MAQPPRRAQFAYLIMATSLILGGLACQLQLGGPKPPDPPADIPSESTESLRQAWASALDSVTQTGETTLTLDETQINALIRQQLAGLENPPILEPQIYLREGQIEVYGISMQGSVEARIHVSIRPFVDPDGQLEFEIPSAEFGPLPAPEALKEAASKSMNELFAGLLGPLAGQVRVTSIVVRDGRLEIVAKFQ